MTMMPFKGRCHTCGHYHDSDEEMFAGLRELMKPERDATIESQAAQIAALTAERGDLRIDVNSKAMFFARLENMQKNGDVWVSTVAVLALLNDCDMLAARTPAPLPSPSKDRCCTQPRTASSPTAARC